MGASVGALIITYQFMSAVCLSRRNNLCVGNNK